MITGMNRAKIPSFIALNTSARDAFSACIWYPRLLEMRWLRIMYRMPIRSPGRNPVAKSPAIDVFATDP